MHLVGAVWSSVTHLLLHLGNNPRDGRTSEEDKPPQAPLAPPETHPVQREISDKEHSELIDPRAKASHYTYSELRKYLDESKDSNTPV
ncbi:hypothetical protein ALC60_13149 [Trachymyrmex zeteki]|uniref:Uncharacterized protein n=1 Tax=Mycetomoellerius zeteki TaxID=64791 RepID=A0A151WIX8_9HYME|nr:hypothetical protein ALC60_13149 [Trachymyrmex zeteki]